MEEKNLKEDLKLTLHELSDAYEELSLLHRISSAFSGRTVGEICENMLAEVTEVCGLDTAAVLFPDGKGFYTRASRGKWDPALCFAKGEGPFAEIIQSNRSTAFCGSKDSGLKDFIPGAVSVLFCPLPGKTRNIGILVIVDVREREFYSGDIKLINAISLQAAAFMENEMLHEEIEEFFLDIIGSYAKALEATSKWTAGHTERVTGYSLCIGSEMGLDPASLENLKICSILHDIGKIAVRPDLLNKQGALSVPEYDEVKRHSDVGADILGKIKAFKDIAHAVRCHHEKWDGSGTMGLSGIEIPLQARILSIADAFDAMVSDRPYRARMSKEEAETELRDCRGSHFDPDIVAAFLKGNCGLESMEENSPKTLIET